MSNPLNSLYVGIDVSKNSNQIYAMNFNQKKLLSFSASNDNEGASKIETKLLECLYKNNLENVVIVLESTGMYSFHIATYLSSSELLANYSVLVYCINPKTSQNYRKSFSEMDKTDPKDSYILADMARVGKVDKLTPVKGPQKLALQRLTRHRKHISDQIVREKLYVLNNIFLKFSAFDRKYDGLSPFSDVFSATGQAVLLEYKSPEEIINTSIEDLTSFLQTVSKNRFEDPKKVAEVLTKCARMSYRLDKAAYDPINTAIASSLCILRCLENELKSINKEIENLTKGFNSDEYKCLISIPGIGPTFAAGILSEIGSIGYHLEFSSKNYGFLSMLSEYLAEFEINAKLLKRKKTYVLYIKDAEQVSDTLALVGANSSVIELQNEIVKRELRNKINRQTNCESGNITKMVNASIKQLEAIDKIESTIGLSALPPDLEEVAILRIANPEESLTDLLKLSTLNLTKSGLNHRLRKLISIADNLT